MMVNEQLIRTWAFDIRLSERWKRRARRRASRRGQPACRGAVPPQPQKNEAVQHEGQRNGEGRDHHQRIG